MDLSPGKESDPRMPFAGFINLVVCKVVVTNRAALDVVLLYQFCFFAQLWPELPIRKEYLKADLRRRDN
jgi:hypothetical protein